VEIQTVIKEIEGTLIQIRTPKGTKTFDIAKTLKIDFDSLTEEFATQAAVYAFFATLVPFAEFTETMLDLSKDQEYAGADDAARKEMTEKGEKFTETVIKSMVQLDEQYGAAFKKHAEAHYDTGIIKAIARAMEQRAEMLISMGAQQRHEFNMQGMNIREKLEKETEMSVKQVKDILKNRQKQV
jgi:hypothetical protein